jgi:hypothetical protein
MELSSAGKSTIDDRRWLWLTHANLDRWYDGWRAFMLEMGFGEERPPSAAATAAGPPLAKGAAPPLATGAAPLAATAAGLGD